MWVYGALRVEASFKQDVDDSLHFRTDLRVSPRETPSDSQKVGFLMLRQSQAQYRWDHFIEGIAFQLKSSVTLSGYIVDSLALYVSPIDKFRQKWDCTGLVYGSPKMLKR